LKSKILIFIDWFLPAYKAGGPIQSIANFVNHFGAELDISIVTSNKDLGDSEPFKNIEFNVWVVKKNYRVIYLDRVNQNRKRYELFLKEQQYDFVYFNSLFSIYFTLIPLWVAIQNKMKIVLAPRGMLGAGALKLKKRKKQIMLGILKLSGISQKLLWQATALSEMNEIKKCFGDETRVHLAPNLSAKMPIHSIKKNKIAGELNLFFLSRIAEKKNLSAALQYLREVNTKYKVRFTIIGPVDEVHYWQRCQEIIKEMPNHINVRLLGAIPNYELPVVLKEEHFMLLPTFHENFGHVIMEAFQSACPVILSDQTPWDELENKKLGWDIPLNKPADFILAIENAAAMDNLTYNEWSLKSFAFAKEFSNNNDIITANRALFN
jgi:glycosyltransferase involved in cell wall biosynthesis